MNSQPARLRRLVALAALSLTLLPATAAAQNSSEDGYRPDGPTVLNQIESGDPSGDTDGGSTPARDRGDDASLPFTGMDLAMLVGAGALLLGLGTGMRLVLRLPPSVR